jgi:hypothetical protein
MPPSGPFVVNEYVAPKDDALSVCEIQPADGTGRFVRNTSLHRGYENVGHGLFETLHHARAHCHALGYTEPAIPLWYAVERWRRPGPADR